MSNDELGVQEVSPGYEFVAENPAVPVGYKQTEVGVIPDDWEVTTLGAIARISSGGTPLRSNSAYWKGDIPWITTTEVDFCTIYQASQFITEAGLNNSAAKLLPPGTLLIALYGQGKTRGKTAVLGIEAATNQACASIEITRRDVCRDYIFHRMVSMYDQIRGLSNTGNQENLNGSLIRSIPIILPQETEQKAIATALSDVDALLEELDRLIAKKRDIKQAAMQQLLTGETRLPGFKGVWETVLLGDLAEMGSGGTPLSSVSAYYDGHIPWVAISDITKNGKVIESTERNLTALGFESSAAQIFPAGTVLYAMYASLGECSIAGVSLCTSQAILGIRTKSRLNSEYLYYYLTFLKPVVKKLGQQGTQANLNKGMVQNFSLSLPSIDEQSAISEVLSDMDAEIQALEQRRSKTAELKQGMMQELLTGRTRLV